MSLAELKASNSAGTAVVYVNGAAKWNNTFEVDHILWQAPPEALKFARKSGLKIDGRTVMIVDSDKDCRGFYFIGENEGGRVKLDLYFRPHFKGRLLSAPGRPRGGANGHMLTTERLNDYLANLAQCMV